ncbi:MAG: hypothetical protein F6K22_16440 [Okeania sp. SIO2F4]|uniref:hypothetical protein n=1 Tax=Okeania sp. SIO2F4 TaxID=2607790 RepID=UPI00142C72A1|nr:hypothetical protein [Okeania sp. SIO2F4]NES04276.1 hypothetical protein [Okeania sp. SIO2F4]
MKRAVSWLTKLFVSSVVAVASVITLGVQQAQAVYTGYCCGQYVALKNNGDFCTIKPESGFSLVTIGNYSGVKATVTVSFDGLQGYSDTILIKKKQSKKVSLPSNKTERIILQNCEGVNFRCDK